MSTGTLYVAANWNRAITERTIEGKPEMTSSLSIGFNYDSTRFEPFVILAVTQPTQDAKEQGTRNAEFALWLIANGIPHKQLIGCYKGQKEISFLIRRDDFQDNPVGLRAWLDGQESILVLSAQEPHRRGQRTAHLTYLANGAKEELGYWTAVSRTDALTQDAWTYDPAFEQYYVVR